MPSRALFTKLAVMALPLAIVLACSETTKPTADGYVTTSSGLMYRDLRVGTGRQPHAGDTAAVHYIVWLSDGTKIDSSRDRGEPFRYIVGRGQVISGFEEGVSTMRVGGLRRLRIPPELAYGESGYPPLIPPNSTLDFEVELLRLMNSGSDPDSSYAARPGAWRDRSQGG